MSGKNPYTPNTQKHRIFEILSDLKWHCAECELPGSQPAKALQGIRQDGYQLEKVGSNWSKTLYCKNCGRNTVHRRLISTEKGAEPIKRVVFSSTIRRRIIELFQGEDEILGYKPTGRAIEIDHRIPEIRWSESEEELEGHVTDEELKSRYMLLVREHNLLKSRYCERCVATGERQPFLGVHYFYAGGFKYLGSCEGCGWYSPSSWREGLNKFLLSFKE